MFVVTGIRALAGTTLPGGAPVTARAAAAAAAGIVAAAAAADGLRS